MASSAALGHSDVWQKKERQKKESSDSHLLVPDLWGDRGFTLIMRVYCF